MRPKTTARLTEIQSVRVVLAAHQGGRWRDPSPQRVPQEKPPGGKLLFFESLVIVHRLLLTVDKAIQVVEPRSRSRPVKLVVGQAVGVFGSIRFRLAHGVP